MAVGLAFAPAGVTVGAPPPPDSPDDLTGLVGWYDFSDISMLFTNSGRTTPVTADGDTINGVTDKSPAGNHLVSTGTGPLYKVGIQNSLSVSQHTAGSLRHASATARATGTYFFVGAKRTAPTASFEAGFSLTANDQNGIGTHTATSATNWFYRSNQAAGRVNTGISAATWHVITAKVESASSLILYADGTQTASFDPNDIVTSGVGWALGEDVGASYGDVDVGAFLVYNSALSDDDRTLVESYLKAIWGTP